MKIERLIEHATRILGVWDSSLSGIVYNGSRLHEEWTQLRSSAAVLSSSPHGWIGANDSTNLLHSPAKREILGRLTRYVLLERHGAGEKIVQHTHCACRDLPETISFFHNQFDRLIVQPLVERGEHAVKVEEIEAFFGCGSLSRDKSEEPPSMMTCLPFDMMQRAACASARPELWDDVTRMLPLAFDCFAHTPFTGSFGPLSLPTLVTALRDRRWGPHTFATARFDPSSFARAGCVIRSLPAFCVQGARISFLLDSVSSSHTRHGAGQERGGRGASSTTSRKSLWLPHCPDSYGEWRRADFLDVHVGDDTAGEVSLSTAVNARRAIVVRISEVASENLWHLLHLLLPLAIQLGPHDTLVLDCAAGSLNTPTSPCQQDSPLLRAFLPAVTTGEIIWLPLQERRCFPRGAAQWGVEHITLFGRDKGVWRGARDALLRRLRRAWDLPGSVLLSPPKSSRGGGLPRRIPPALPTSYAASPHGATTPASSGEPRPFQKPKLVFALRLHADSRRVVNLEEVRSLLLSARFLARWDVKILDLSEYSVVDQARAVAGSLLVGPHGQALAWLPLATLGCVELMPHMKNLWTELCRPGWNQTPMYAYGGLALVMGRAHICLLGKDHHGGMSLSPARSVGLGEELNSWIRRDVVVDVEGLASVLEERYAQLWKEGLLFLGSDEAQPSTRTVEEDLLDAPGTGRGTEGSRTLTPKTPVDENTSGRDGPAGSPVISEEDKFFAAEELSAGFSPGKAVVRQAVHREESEFISGRSFLHISANVSASVFHESQSSEHGNIAGWKLPQGTTPRTTAYIPKNITMCTTTAGQVLLLVSVPLPHPEPWVFRTRTFPHCRCSLAPSRPSRPPQTSRDRRRWGEVPSAISSNKRPPRRLPAMERRAQLPPTPAPLRIVLRRCWRWIKSRFARTRRTKNSFCANTISW